MSVVGTIVGPINEGTGSGAGPSAQPSSGDDFAINDLFFKVRITNDTPYQRATAQFQKDQLDTGHNAGDQSLTGWWTRGQYSFHKGAGIIYYDTGTTVRLNEDLTVLNHFADADGLDPFDPGKLTCQRAWSTPVSGGSFSQAACIGSYLLAMDGTALRYSSGTGLGSTYTPSAGATVRAFTTSTTLAYVVLDNGKIASFDPATATETILYTGLTTTARGLWYVKGRLVVSDSNGKWYQLAASPTAPPVAVASTDVVFTAPDWQANSSVTDTPGPILLANGNRAFALSLDSTGTIPALSAPVQVVELPPGEVIDAITQHLGFVVLVTGAGVRIGVVDSNGQVSYGPVLIERASSVHTFSATQIARYGTRVAVVLDSRIYEIDLAQQVGQGLEFAYTGRGTPGGVATVAGLSTYQYDTLIAWKDASLWHSAPSDNYAEGSLTTGYHRFATLEEKRFDTVRVNITGTHGTVTVSRVDANGTAISLYTIDASVSHVEDIPFRMDEGEISVALKFDLVPDPSHLTETPTLLGYQIRALPQPQRQEMIKVPLMVQDTERRQPARMTGRKKSAWERYRALKDLENSSSIISFTDYRTGESGRAYVESVEFNDTTPPTNGSSGFGGVASVTLRKL